MECPQRGRQPFVVAGQTAKARGPSKTSFHHPSPRQQNKAALGFGVLDHFLANAVFGRSLFGGLASVALIDICQLHALPRDLLHLFGQFAYRDPARRPQSHAESANGLRNL